MTRPTQVIINLEALRHNFSRVRKLAPNSRVISIVKTNAYGHGLVRIAKALSETDGFGVACIEEAMELREAGIDKPIILLEGPYSSEEVANIEEFYLDTVIHHDEQISMIEKSNIRSPINVWLKIDTGMHRLGFSPSELKSIWDRLTGCNKINHDIVLMTHLANAGDLDSKKTSIQLNSFNNICDTLQGRRTIANSAGIIGWPGTHRDYVRPGLMLYGISPMENNVAKDQDLKPVMSLQSKLISIKTVSKGEFVGYGGDWCCPQTMPIGIVAAGYADGYPRSAKSGTPILVNHTSSQIIGNPSMDMLAVDLRNFKNVQVGDPVELWGSRLPVEMVAKCASTIAYELVSKVHKRLKVIVNDN